MTARSYTVAKGDTSPIWRVGHLDADGNELTLDGNYSCTIAVKGTAISRAVIEKDADSKRFLAALAAVETDQLEAGKSYTVAVQLDNGATTPPLSTERCFTLFIKEGVI